LDLVGAAIVPTISCFYWEAEMQYAELTQDDVDLIRVSLECFALGLKSDTSPDDEDQLISNENYVRTMELLDKFGGPMSFGSS
jgi:hypothetical protein